MSRFKYAVDSKHMSHWVERIGKLIVNFSALEMECIHWLVQLSEDATVLSSLGESQFKTRTAQVMQLVEARSIGSAWRREAIGSWNKALRLAELRNRVAHNPIVFAWKSAHEIGEPDFIGVPSLRRKGTPPKESLLSGPTIDAAVDETADLAQRLHRLRQQWCGVRDKGKAPSVPAKREASPSIWKQLTLAASSTIRWLRAK